jgi:hypothetical protein
MTRLAACRSMPLSIRALKDEWVEYDDGEEHGQNPLVGDGEGRHSPRRNPLHPVLQDGLIPSERPHADHRAASPTTHSVARHPR